MGVFSRYLAAAGAAACIAAIWATAGFAGSNSVKRATRTYATGGTAPLATALVDPWLFNSRQTSKAFALTRAAGASYVRVTINWSGIAPSVRPSDFVATDPTSAGYSWGNADSVVQQAEAAGLTPI